MKRTAKIVINMANRPRAPRSRIDGHVSGTGADFGKHPSDIHSILDGFSRQGGGKQGNRAVVYPMNAWSGSSPLTPQECVMPGRTAHGAGGPHRAQSPSSRLARNRIHALCDGKTTPDACRRWTEDLATPWEPGNDHPRRLVHAELASALAFVMRVCGATRYQDHRSCLLAGIQARTLLMATGVHRDAQTRRTERCRTSPMAL